MDRTTLSLQDPLTTTGCGGPSRSDVQVALATPFAVELARGEVGELVTEHLFEECVIGFVEASVEEAREADEAPLG